jgi:hypothetical protein
MPSPSQQSWLYVRGDESIQIIKLPTASILLVCGPDRQQQTYPFDTDLLLENFRRSHGQQLLADGWTLHGTHERRVEIPSSHSGVERRRSEQE